MVGKYSQGSEVNIQGDGNELSDVGNDKSNRQYQAGSTTGDNNAAGTSGESDSGSGLASAFSQCTSGGSSLGSTAVCIEENSGQDIKIEGGLAYVNGSLYTELNEWEAAKVE